VSESLLRVGALDVGLDVDGAGSPVVLVHGGLGSRRLWAPQVAALGGRYKIIAYDLRGHGDTRSQGRPHSYGPKLLAADLEGLALIAGGRSAGARVACRTAATTGARAVLCLAFPLQPPRRAGGKQSPSRLDELDGVAVPTLLVQGEGDQFGMPPAGPQRTVARVAGSHSLHSDREAVVDAVAAWLADVDLARSYS